MQNGAPRYRAQAQLSETVEGELARGLRIRPLRTLAASLAAPCAPLPENLNDFGLLCAQVYAPILAIEGNFQPQDRWFGAGRVPSQHKRNRAANQALVVGLLARDSRSVRSERRALHSVAVCRLYAVAMSILMAECQHVVRP